MLQETHWQHDGAWFADNFYCMHSSTGLHRRGGLLMMIAKHVASISHIAWQVLHPGRLLHVRIFGTQRNTDLINCYQYTCKLHRAADRSTLLQKLADVLDTLPRRNLLYIAGDFNTTLAIQSEVVGVRSYRFQQQKQLGTIHQDWDELHSLCLRHRLIALNTWCADSPPTFSSPTGHSRIDYIFARKQVMDSTSKQVHHLTDFPLLILNGNNHIPLVTEVPSKWIFNQSPRQCGWSKHARDNLYQGWKHDTLYWQRGTEALQEKLEHFTASPDLRLHTIHEDINQCFPITPGAQQTKQEGGNMELFKQFQSFTINLTRSCSTDLEDGYNGLAFCFNT